MSQLDSVYLSIIKDDKYVLEQIVQNIKNIESYCKSNMERK